MVFPQVAATRLEVSILGVVSITQVQAYAQNAEYSQV